ncbi:hypothetical protein FB451DRAFT_1186710 [Mycena latifolia]|nr:hypothetical protein FB451DRAFT_1186710 [Mycena latifolia]
MAVKGRNSIMNRTYMPRGFDQPSPVATHTTQKLAQSTGAAAVSLPSRKPTFKFTGTRARTEGKATPLIDDKACPVPLCYVKEQPGKQWDVDDRSYTSYDIVWHPSTNAEGTPNPVEIQFGMGIELSGREALSPRSGTFCFVLPSFRNDPEMKARARGMIALISTYIPDVTDPSPKETLTFTINEIIVHPYRQLDALAHPVAAEGILLFKNDGMLSLKTRTAPFLIKPWPGVQANLFTSLAAVGKALIAVQFANSQANSGVCSLFLRACELVQGQTSPQAPPNLHKLRKVTSFDGRLWTTVPSPETTGHMSTGTTKTGGPERFYVFGVLEDTNRPDVGAQIAHATPAPSEAPIAAAATAVAHSVAIAQVDEPKDYVKRTMRKLMHRIAPKFSSHKPSEPALIKLPLYEYVARGWDETNKIWRNPVWPTEAPDMMLELELIEGKERDPPSVEVHGAAAKESTATPNPVTGSSDTDAGSSGQGQYKGTYQSMTIQCMSQRPKPSCGHLFPTSRRPADGVVGINPVRALTWIFEKYDSASLDLPPRVTWRDYFSEHLSQRTQLVETENPDSQDNSEIPGPTLESMHIASAFLVHLVHCITETDDTQLEARSAHSGLRLRDFNGRQIMDSTSPPDLRSFLGIFLEGNEESRIVTRGNFGLRDPNEANLLSSETWDPWMKRFNDDAENTPATLDLYAILEDDTDSCPHCKIRNPVKNPLPGNFQQCPPPQTPHNSDISNGNAIVPSTPRSPIVSDGTTELEQPINIPVSGSAVEPTFYAPSSPVVRASGLSVPKHVQVIRRRKPGLIDAADDSRTAATPTSPFENDVVNEQTGLIDAADNSITAGTHTPPNYLEFLHELYMTVWLGLPDRYSRNVPHPSLLADHGDGANQALYKCWVTEWTRMGCATFVLFWASSDLIVWMLVQLSTICLFFGTIYAIDIILLLTFEKLGTTTEGLNWIHQVHRPPKNPLWNPWIMLSMPAVWILWGVIYLLFSILASSDPDDEKDQHSKSSLKQHHASRFTAAFISVLGVIYLRLMRRDVKRMGSDSRTMHRMEGLSWSLTTFYPIWGGAGQIVQVFGHIFNNNINGGGGGSGGHTGGNGGNALLEFSPGPYYNSILGGGGGTGGNIGGRGSNGEGPSAESSSGGHLGNLSGGIGGSGGSGRTGGRGGDGEGPHVQTMPGGYQHFWSDSTFEHTHRVSRLVGGTGGADGPCTDVGGEGGRGGAPTTQ